MPAASLVLDVPEYWRVSSQPDRQRYVVSDTDTWVSVRYSDAAGQMLACRGAACTPVAVAGLDDLVSLAQRSYQDRGFGPGHVVEQVPIEVSGGAGARLAISADAMGFPSAEYVLAYRSGQAILVEASVGVATLAAFPDMEFADILASIRFLD